MKQILFAFAVIIVAASCTKDKAPKPTKVFSVAKFKANLKEGIKNAAESQPRGYSFVINQNGKWADTCSTGWGYTVGDRVSGMRPDLEINIASVTKSITSVAVQQLLKKNDLKLTDNIGPWLPAYFNAVKAFRDITFGELLTHTSGISTAATSYEAMKTLAISGLENPAKPAKYSNMNFALFRAIIPYLNNKNSVSQKEKLMVPGDTEDFEFWLSQQYIAYMQAHVFTPIGIASALCKPDGNTAMAFNEDLKVVSHTPGDWTNDAGGGGYYLTTMEMARFMAYLSHSETLLSKEQRKQMDDNLLGWDADDSYMTVAGKSYGKGGLLFWGDPGLQTLVVKYPNNVELALSVNSWPGKKRQLSIIAKDAYDNAWE